LTVRNQAAIVPSMETDKIGSVGQRVAANMKHFRGRMGVRELSRRMTDLGRPILPSGITKIELGQRRVDADDLVALAVALEVNVNALLMPRDPAAQGVELTPDYATSGEMAWRWAVGEYPALHWEGDRILGGWETDSRTVSIALMDLWYERVRPYEDDDERDAWTRQHGKQWRAEMRKAAEDGKR